MKTLQNYLRKVSAPCSFRIRKSAIALAITALACAASTASAQNVWNNSSGGDWGVAANWSLGVVPTDGALVAANNAYFNAINVPYTITTGSNARGFNFSSTSTDDVTFDLTGGGSLTTTYAFVSNGQAGITGNGIFSSNGMTIGSQSDNGGFSVSGGAAYTPFASTNLISIGLATTATTASNSTLEISGLGSSFTVGTGGAYIGNVQNASATTSGNTLNVLDAGTMTVNGGGVTVGFRTAGTSNLNSLTIGGAVSGNEAELTINGGNLTVGSAGVANARVFINTGGRLTATVGNATVNNGVGNRITVDGGVFDMTGRTMTNSREMIVQNSGSWTVGASTTAASTANFFFNGGTVTADTFTLATAGSTMTVQNGAEMNVNSLTISSVNAANGTSSVGGFTGSTINTGSTLVNSGALFYVGSTGGVASTLNLVGNGTHTFNNGLEIGSGGTGSVLSGNGTINGNVQVNGILSPGNSIGTLNITGNVAMGSTGAFNVELGRNGLNPESDRVNVTGTVSLDSDLRLSLNTGFANPEIGDIFFLLTNDVVDPILGSFTSLNGVATDLSEGSQFSWNSQLWEITYAANFSSTSFTGGNDLALQVIPEPGSVALLAIGAGLLLGRRRGVLRGQQK